MWPLFDSSHCIRVGIWSATMRSQWLLSIGLPAWAWPCTRVGGNHWTNYSRLISCQRSCSISEEYCGEWCDVSSTVKIELVFVFVQWSRRGQRQFGAPGDLVLIYTAWVLNITLLAGVCFNRIFVFSCVTDTNWACWEINDKRIIIMGVFFSSDV